MIGIGINTTLRVIGGFDADAQAFFARVTAAGGTLTTTEKNATNQLVLDMKSAGIWTSMKAVYPMVGASAAACAQNLKSSSFTGAFSPGWTFASTGVTPNGTSAYFDTNLNPNSTLSQFSSHMSYYSRTNSGGAFVEMGADLAPNRIVLHIKYATAGYYDQNDTTNGRIGVPFSESSACFSLMSRTSNNSQFAQMNGVTRGTNTNTITSLLPNRDIYLGGLNADAFSLATDRQCAFASIGDGLTDTQASNFYTAVQTMQTTLSRAIAP